MVDSSFLCSVVVLGFRWLPERKGAHQNAHKYAFSMTVLSVCSSGVRFSRVQTSWIDVATSIGSHLVVHPNRARDSNIGGQYMCLSWLKQAKKKTRDKSSWIIEMMWYWKLPSSSWHLLRTAAPDDSDGADFTLFKFTSVWKVWSLLNVCSDGSSSARIETRQGYKRGCLRRQSFPSEFTGIRLPPCKWSSSNGGVQHDWRNRK